MSFYEILALIAAVGAAIGVIIKYIVQPLEKFGAAMDKIVLLDESNKIMLECLLAIMNNLITGNGVDKLKDKRDQLEAFCINK